MTPMKYYGCLRGKKVQFVIFLPTWVGVVNTVRALNQISAEDDATFTAAAATVQHKVNNGGE